MMNEREQSGQNTSQPPGDDQTTELRTVNGTNYQWSFNRSSQILIIIFPAEIRIEPSQSRIHSGLAETQRCIYM
jgi:hypothetical protein